MAKSKPRPSDPPASVLVLSCPVEIKASDTLRDEDTCGQYNKKETVCRYDPAMAPQMQRRTVLHELLHTIEHLQALKLKEREVVALETGLFSLLKDNPELVAWLLEE